MSLLDVIEVDYHGMTRRIELHAGDLTQLGPNDAVDLLILSAFPNDYLPTRTSLIGALYQKGLCVDALSQDKAVDLRDAFSCWISKPISSGLASLQFSRILCFEPLIRGEPPELVGDIFRALSPFLGDNPPIRSAAMPIVAAGDQGYPVSNMLVPLIEACVNWMGIGLPLETLKIFAHSKQTATEAANTFAQLKSRVRPPKRASHFEFDVFVSYSRQNAAPGKELASILADAKLKVYIDVNSIEKGTAWQSHIFHALDNCEKMVAIYSPQYIESKICQEEFNIAWTRSRDEKAQIIFPIYWQSTKLPTYMKMLDFIDCREGNVHRLQSACNELVASLGSQRNAN